MYPPEKKIFDAGRNDSCMTFNKEPGDCIIIVNREHIKHVVLPTAWVKFNNFPFYMSIVVQQGWSMKHEVNFLAANVQYISYSDN